MANKLYIIRIDVAYNGEFYVIPHTNRKVALKDFYKRIKKWEDDLKVPAEKLTESDALIEIDVRDPKSEEGASFYFNEVTSAEELIL
ncbi:hypothetical protein MOD71_18660 [Bacillus haynesii]|uniref:hypothetical protein n=1 Tax=Bacillus haynesii TaxID=1925021 RepID=UPI0022823426|nr:hypothetical protein [Bacillus haynesii]MCY8737529.1 hypothetical protein [Bacillus haynesii]